MKSAVENLTATRVKLNVEVPFEELKPSIDAAYKTVASQIQVPGFRKGKVPSKLIDQRVGRGYVLETAINDGLNGWYQAAVQETGVRPLSRPEVEITEVPDPSATDGELKFQVEVDVRPEIELPDYAGIKVEVAAAESSDADVDKALDELRGRFGTLKSVERPAQNDDFLTIDITASIDGEEIDSASGLSYQVGSATMLEGLDEAVSGLSADEEAIFDTTLVGGEHAGEAAQVKVVVKAVKERELPEANDDFAQLASEFDTLAELREDLAKQAAESKVVGQGVEARDKVLDKLVELVEVPVPASVVEEQVEAHFTQENSHGEGDHDTEEHRAEVKANTERAFQNEVILDAIADKEEVNVSQNELIDYIVTTASQYGMDPNQFAQIIDQSGQVPMMVSEVRRRKALAVVLGQAEVVDSEGNKVDLTDFVRPAGEVAAEETAEAEAEAETVSSDDPAAVKF
ncbi:trigger factor [Arthrobacter sp. TES]|uniref:Trigger factor n=1 Tax=Paenarthrobacter ureafaciens TaxID=37931 RepID=A0AAX3ECJ3_PAEUR|nr:MULTISPECIES: trigger factor [Paenarthrobacter]AMB40817.1 trigger factor [Arthrobacter sp. ATCC 21022]AOY71131.1 trigger factor [Arthrobacter sp. ZXY-2]ERI39699.1 trigger factor [Arthrobacter sp. AK-YN10]NKR10913.1 trigger factor [Arthrobacter sp. M5]NKR18507.1 trigger factor [Arthrobacter sp. M6]OEH57150.1 trigger factor [Arthrobacter sp. D2]OEH64593.1 trigger factor [Arthrobacter sp. D4]QOI63031.1 trigger factor [Arthrobacter sp. TES]BCW84633.1 trigger factor [Arthrobacter sp. NicSoil